MNVDPELRKRVEQIKSSPVQLYREAGDYSNRELVEGILVSPDDIAAIEAVAREEIVGAVEELPKTGLAILGGPDMVSREAVLEVVRDPAEAAQHRMVPARPLPAMGAVSKRESPDLSDCPQCGEWRDGPRADCANCGYSPRPCGDPLGLCLYNAPHPGRDHVVGRYDRSSGQEVTDTNVTYSARALIAARLTDERSALAPENEWEAGYHDGLKFALDMIDKGRVGVE